MKVCVTLILALCSLTACSQKLMVSGGVGILNNTAPIYMILTEGRASAMAHVRAGADIRKIQVGVGCYFSRYEFNVLRNASQTIVGSFGFVNPYIYLNKNDMRSNLYYGMQMGYGFFSNNAKTMQVTNGQGHEIVSPSFTGGLQLGCRFKISKALIVAPEIGARYVTASPLFYASGGYSGQRGFLSFPVTVGVEYRLRKGVSL